MADEQRTSEEVFWARVQKSDGCWIWMGARSPSGYGTFYFKRKTLRAHRIAYMLAHGPIPDGLCVLHACDVPACVRLDHLWLGTNKENTADMIRKGRQGFARGEKSGARTHPESIRRGPDSPLWGKPALKVRGERHGNAKLTRANVGEIRERYTRGGCTHSELAADYGVSRRNIGKIVSGRLWGDQ